VRTVRLQKRDSVTVRSSVLGGRGAEERHIVGTVVGHLLNLAGSADSSTHSLQCLPLPLVFGRELRAIRERSAHKEKQFLQ
jgi:hypothetical protein